MVIFHYAVTLPVGKIHWFQMGPGDFAAANTGRVDPCGHHLHDLDHF